MEAKSEINKVLHMARLMVMYILNDIRIEFLNQPLFLEIFSHVSVGMEDCWIREVKEDEVVERTRVKKMGIKKTSKNQERLVKQWEKEGARLLC